MNLKVGDKVIIIADVHYKGEISTIKDVIDGIAYTDVYMGVGYHATTGAGRLDREDGAPFIRKLTPLDDLL